MRRRIWGLWIVALFVVAGMAPNAFADSYTYTSAGCFVGSGCTSSGSSMRFADWITGATDATLSFTNITTPITTTSGVPVSLGSFSFSLLNSGFSPLDAGLFTLNLDFTNPAGTAGNPFIAVVMGSVSVNASGAIITLLPDAQLFSYPGGSFMLDLITDPIKVSAANPTAEVSARIGTIVSVPEGSSLTMLSVSGLVLFAAFFIKLTPWGVNAAS